jgi:hypothetical protein
MWKPMPKKIPKRKKNPWFASIEDVTISKRGDQAIIKFKDASTGDVHLTIGPGIKDMTEEEILDMYNNVIGVQDLMRMESTWVPKEIPPGLPQMKYRPELGYWTMRGDVLRCEVSDGGPDMETTIIIDDQEYSMEEFGDAIHRYNGWGMRVTFVDREDLESNPEIEIAEPEDED